MSWLSKKVATPSNIVRALNPSSILGSKVFKMDPAQYTKAQIAIGAGALGAGALMNRSPTTGPGPGGIPMANASNTSGVLSASGGGSSFNPWSLVAPVIGAATDIWSANKLASGQQEANTTNLESAREQMDFQAKQTSQQMDYQTQMSNTAHQREVADLKAAGLNPVLSANSGASTPVGASGSGAMASVGNAAPDYRGIIPKGIDTAINLKQMQKDFEQKDSSIALNAAAASREAANAVVARNTAKKIQQDTRNAEANADMNSMARDYSKKHPWVYKSGQWIKHLSPFTNSAAELGTLVP